MTGVATQLVPMARQSNFLVPNATFFVELRAFALLFYLLAKYVIPPINRAMTSRQDAIRTEFADLDQARPRPTPPRRSSRRRSPTRGTRRPGSARRPASRAPQIVAEMREQAQSEAARIVDARARADRGRAAAGRRVAARRGRHAGDHARRADRRRVPRGRRRAAAAWSTASSPTSSPGDAPRPLPHGCSRRGRLMLRGASAEARAELASKVALPARSRRPRRWATSCSRSAGCCGPSRRCAGSSPTRSLDGRGQGRPGRQSLRRQGRRPDARPGQGGRPAALDRSRDLADVLERARRPGTGPLGRRPGLDGSATSCSRSASSSTANPDLRDALVRPGPQRRRQGGAARLACSTARCSRPRCASSSRRVRGTYRRSAARCERLPRVAADVQDELVAVVHVARPLGADRDQPADPGARQGSTTRPVHLHVVVDPDLIGGMRVEIGDDVIDGSVASQARRRPPAHRRLSRTTTPERTQRPAPRSNREEATR